MASVNYVAHQLAQMGLEVDVDGGFILCEDPGLDFERSHDGVRGISRWFTEVKDEYEATLKELLEESADEEAAEAKEWSEEEQQALANDGPGSPYPNKEEPMEEFATAPPVKAHEGHEAQMEIAREFNSPKETAQSGDDQDRGGIPRPEAYITEMKLEAPAITVLVRGHTFHAPDGWKIKEVQPDNVFYMGSINIGRKKNHELRGSRFSLVRQ